MATDLIQAIERYARRGGHAAIVVDDESLTYRDLRREAQQCAWALQKAGVRTGDRVVAVLPNSPLFVILFVACVLREAVFVPVSTWSTDTELLNQLTDSRPTAIVAAKGLGKKAFGDVVETYGRSSDISIATAVTDELASSKVVVDQLSAHAAASLAPSHHGPTGFRAGRPGARAQAVIYTSGTTGQPKGVVLGQKSLWDNAGAMASRMGISEGDRVFSYFPFFFSGGFCNSLTGSLMSGATLVTQRQFTPETAMDMIVEWKCTARLLWSDALGLLSKAVNFDAVAVGNMRRGLANDPLLHAQLQLPPDEGIRMYGMSETTVCAASTYYREPENVRLASYGFPVDGCQVQIFSHDDIESPPLPAGTEGEIGVRGRNLFLSYTDSTRPLDTHGFFRTGDRGLLDRDGRLHFLGRYKSLIKKQGGLSIQPEEVEEFLSRHPDVAEAVVVGIRRADGESIEADTIVALVRPVGGVDSALVGKALTAYCRGDLSSYKIPDRFCILRAEAIPRTTSGKVDRVAVERLAARIVTGP